MVRQELLGIYVNPNKSEANFAIETSKCSRKELSLIEINGVKDDCDDITLIRSGNLPINLIKSYGEKWKDVVFIRNEIIFTTLKNVCSRDQVPARIAVVYGSGHMPFIEDYLLQNSFKPIIGSEGWLVLANLCPLPKPIETSATDVKKIYFSTDGLMKIYLIGSLTNNKFSKADRLFVLSRIFGWEKSENGEVVEIAYTPDDIDYVAENLSRSGYVLISEVPFIRKNNKKWHCVCRNSSYVCEKNFEIALESTF